ncbi:MAG TPA: hypothetical protein VFA84_14645 [Acidimicrobiales bacterium]|nr:hypothetical protein [Acidimicrobiales bacterium]
MAAVTYDTRASDLRVMARARRRNRAAGVDVFEGFYQAYLTAFGCAVAVLLSSDAIGDNKVTPHQLHDVVTRGPGVIGLGIAVVFAVAVRSGSRGGPLVLPAADVRHVLLAPVRRDRALRSAAVRQVRFSAFVGLVIGAGLAVLASHRLGGGGAPAWAPVGAAVGGAVGATAAGLGLVCSGRRVRPWAGLLIAAALIGWSGADVALGRVTSPMGLLGQFALTPLKFHPASVGVAALVAVVAVAGVVGIGGLSIEQAERRATLASQIRFALTLQDLRTVVLLRRQLTQEQSRPKPWVRLGPLGHGRRVVWRRDVRGLMRWPAVRLVRLAVLGIIAGAALAGTFAGTTPLIVVAAVALFLAGLEALEPLAQDIDHPDLPSGTPTVPGELRLAHAPVPLAVMVVVALVGWATAIVMAAAGLFSVPLALTVGATLIAPAALLGLVGGAASVVMEPPSSGGDFLPAEVAGVKTVLRAVWSPALVVIGLTPVLVARSALHHTGAHRSSPGGAALSASFLPITVGLIGMGWLRFREDVRQSFSMTPPPAKP